MLIPTPQSEMDSESCRREQKLWPIDHSGRFIPALLAGGAGRIAADPYTGLNKYLCQGALGAIAKATELDYFGVECGIDHNRRIAVFEVNAAMLVHDEKRVPTSARNQSITRIRVAFDAILAERGLHGGDDRPNA